MTETDRPAFAGIVCGLAVTFNRPPSDTLVNAYWIALRDLELADVEKAAARALAESRFMPVPAELRAFIAGNSVTRAMEAWGRVLVAIRKCGYLRAPSFKDPLISHVIQQLGGWVAVCRRDADELHNWTRKEFERLYTALRETAPAAPVQLHGMHDRPRLAEPATTAALLGEWTEGKDVQ